MNAEDEFVVEMAAAVVGLVVTIEPLWPFATVEATGALKPIGAGVSAFRPMGAAMPEPFSDWFAMSVAALRATTAELATEENVGAMEGEVPSKWVFVWCLPIAISSLV